jgi:hypothetical protein
MSKIDAAMVSMAENLKEKTGKSLEEWVSILKRKNFEKHGEMVAFLKKEHGMGHGYANLVAHTSRGGIALSAGVPLAAKGSGNPVDGIYTGPKSSLRPIHDSLMAAILKFGNDVELAPKKGYVSLRRSKQFALIQPSTKDRVDVGIQLKGVAPKGRLEASGSFNAMVSHRVRVTSVQDVDKELIGWIRMAYDAS